MPPTDVLLLHPPATKPGEPPLGPAILAGHLRAHGHSVAVLDANLDAYLHLLDPQVARRAAGAEPATTVRRALGQAERALALLRSPQAATSFARYSTALHHLHTVLSVYGRPGERLTLGDYEQAGCSPYAPDALAALAAGDATTLFRPYFADVLLPRIVALQPRLVALTVNYRHQALPAFELAGLIRRALPTTRLVAGGGLITSWRRTLCTTGLRLPPFDQLVFGPGEGPLLQLARGQGEEAWRDGAEIAFAPDFAGWPLADYLSPAPLLPLATARGCYWGQCHFCPEAAAPTHPYAPHPADLLIKRMRALAATGVRHFHLTDNAIPVTTLRALADHAEQLQGVRWHGFVRFEKALNDAQLTDGLARSGCAVLQLGLESGSQRVLDRMAKGTQLTEVSAILKQLRRAGIATYVYAMVGIPGENAADAAATRRFLLDHEEEIGFLNLALMNLPRDAGLLSSAADYDIAAADLHDPAAPLGLYRGFAGTSGWGRAEARRFLGELRSTPEIRNILKRTPPWFTSNHACFFSPWAQNPD